MNSRRAVQSIAAFASLLAVAFLLAGCGGGGGGDAPVATTGSVEGYVYTPQTRAATVAVGRQVPSGTDPVGGALVAVVGTVLDATTNVQGYFRIDNVPIGQQTLRVTKAGFAPSDAIVTIAGGQVTRVNDTSGGVMLTTHRAKWTFMVYMNGDNDLEQWAIEDLNQMERIGSTTEVNLVVEVDRNGGYDSSNGDWTGGRRYYLTKDPNTSENDSTGTIRSQLLADYGEIDMGDPQRLKAFVSWAMTEYPAEFYVLDLWNHGAGWDDTRARSRGRGFSYDWTSSHDFIKTSDLPAAIAGPDHIDIVAWDSSLMQMVEVADQLGTAATIMVGSEESPPAEGYPYHAFLDDLAANPSLTPEQFSVLIVNETLREMGATFTLTQSAVRLSNVPALRQAISAFGDALTSAMPQHAAEIAAARGEAQNYGHGQSPYTDYKDLQDYAEKIKAKVNDATVHARADAVIAALQAALLAENHSNAVGVQDSHGLSLYVPAPASYLAVYGNLAFAQNSNWDEFLRGQTQ